MFSKLISTHAKIFNLWLLFLLALVTMAGFRHWGTVETLTWLNCAFFFFLFLQSAFIVSREVHHRDVFVNLAIWAGLSSIQILNPFIGPGYAFGGSELTAYAVLDFRRMIMPALATYVIIHLVLKVAFAEVKAWRLAAVSLAGSIALAVYLFRAVLFGSPVEDTSLIIAQQTVKLLLFPFIALGIYGVYHFRRDHAISDHISVLLGFFFVYLVIELTDIVTLLNQIKLYSVSQVVLTGLLIFLMITFFNRLNYISSEFGQYYERLLMRGHTTGLQIIRKQSRSLQPVVDFVRGYFTEKPRFAAVTVIGIVFAMNYVELPDSAKIFVLAFATTFFLVCLYWSVLSRKRGLENHILRFKN